MSEFARFKPQHISLSNWRDEDHIKWALSHFSFMPTLDIPRDGRVNTIPTAPRNDFEAFEFDHLGTKTSLLEALTGDDVDGYIVIKDGVIIYERYFQQFTAHHKHLWASATKSIIGSLFGIIVEEFKVDLDKSPAEYIPDLDNSAFACVTVRNVLNMVSALNFSEDYDKFPSGSVHFEYFRRLGLIPAWDLMQSDPRNNSTPRGARGYLAQFQTNPENAVGSTFEYHSPNVDVIGWLIEAVTKMPLTEFLRSRFWSKIGAEHDAFVACDTEFNPIATGGFNSTLRDAARFGLLALNEGRIGDDRIINSQWVKDTYTLTDADRIAWSRSIFNDNCAETHMPDFQGYRSFWWVCDAAKGERVAMGIYGQMIYVNKAANIVIASFSSPISVSNVRRPSFKRVLRANRCLAATL